MSNTIHILPVDDIIIHSESEDCICKPRIILVPISLVPVGEVGGGKIIVHHSGDGRELYESREDGEA